MSYYTADYFKNPMPYYDGPSARRTVPGWGQLPRSAGNARIGVGLDLSQMDRSALLKRVSSEPGGSDTYTPTPADESFVGSIPWWVWVAAPGVIAGGLALAVNMGWIGSEV
jgi:hypothetical protein